MSKKIYIFLLISAFRIYPDILPKRQWTFITYIAGDNSLASMVDDDIKEMQHGANDNVNVLVYANVKENKKKLAKKIILTKKDQILVDVKQNLDSGVPTTLMNALTWTFDAPSDYLAVGLWNHGTGVLNPEYTKRGICFDDSTGHYLNDRDLQTDLEAFVKQRAGKKIDVLFLDACLMANIESLVSWGDYINFMVASEQTIPGEGYNYQYVLNYLSKNSANPKAFAFEIVNAYKRNYEKLENDYTLSAISTAKIKKLGINVNKVAKNLLDLYKIDPSTVRIIRESRNNTIYFQEPSYIDLGHFYANLLANMNKLKITKSENKLINNLRDLLMKGIYLINRCVINNVTGPYYSSATGISIYFPIEEIDPSYERLIWTEKYPQWNELLKKIVK